MSKIKLGFVGVGMMGQMAHLRNYATLDDCEIVALAESRPQLARQVATHYGIPQIYANPQTMLAKESLDAVVACLQFGHHATVLPLVYPKVKHVFTEKPLAISVAAAEKLVATAAQSDSTHVVGYHKRSDPAVTTARAIMDTWQKSGEMGALKYIRILMPAGDWIANGFAGVIRTDEPVPDFPTEPPPPEFTPAIAREYISFVNYYIHQVNLMHYLMNEMCHVTFAEKSGVLLGVESASGIPGIIEMTPYQTTVAWEEEVLVAFTRGYIKIKLPAPLAIHRPGSVEVYENAANTTPRRYFPTLPWDDAMLQQARNFLCVCRGELSPPCTAFEAVADLKIAREYIQMRFQ